MNYPSHGPPPPLGTLFPRRFYPLGGFRRGFNEASLAWGMGSEDLLSAFALLFLALWLVSRGFVSSAGLVSLYPTSSPVPFFYPDFVLGLLGFPKSCCSPELDISSIYFMHLQFTKKKLYGFL